jgi:hypothetical protein
MAALEPIYRSCGPIYGWVEGLRPCNPHRLHRLGNTQNADHSLEVICKDVQDHFGADVIERLHQEVRRAHPVLQCSEDVFDRSTSYPHRVRLAIKTSLHLLEYGLVLPAPDTALVARGALFLERAMRAYISPVGMGRQPLLDRSLMAPQALTSGAGVFVVLRDVDEVEFAVAPRLPLRLRSLAWGRRS